MTAKDAMETLNSVHSTPAMHGPSVTVERKSKAIVWSTLYKEVKDLAPMQTVRPETAAQLRREFLGEAIPQPTEKEEQKE